MTEITTVIPRRYIEGKEVKDGRAIFEDGELEDAVLDLYRKNPKFTVREVSGAGLQQVDENYVFDFFVKLEEEYGVDFSVPKGLVFDAIEEARGGKKPGAKVVDNPDKEKK